MTAATRDIKSPVFDSPLTSNSYPVAGTTTIYEGTMVALNASGYAVPASASAAQVLVGQCQKQVDNSTGSNGDLSVDVFQGIFYFTNASGSGAVTAGDLERSFVYAADDQTISITNAAGTYPVAGVAKKLGSSADSTSGLVAVQIPGAPPGAISPYALSPSSAAQPFYARGVAAAGNVASLAAFTVASNDGITYVAGDVVVLLEQTTATQNGPYVVGTVAAGAAPLTRPDWWRTGQTLPGGVQIKLGGEGTVFKNATLRAMVAAKSFVVGTTDPQLYPIEVSGTGVLSSGTFTISTVPVFSAKSNVLLSRVATGGTPNNTIQYNPTTGGATGITPGIRGTAAVIVEACVAAGTINTADTSTLHWTIVNQA